MGLQNATGVGLVAIALIIWVAAFMFNGFYAQSELFDISIIDEDRQESFQASVDDLNDGEFSVLDSLDFISTTWITFVNLPWFVLLITNVIPLIIFLLGLLALARGGS